MGELGYYLAYIGILIAYGVFSIGVYLLLIGIVVGVHEFGHYQMARWCNIKVLEFSLGFGKVLYQKELTKDKTLFTIRMLPLGGFVKPLDQNSIEKDEWDLLSQEDKLRAYSKVNRAKKILMIAGGPAINFILAFFLYLGAMVFIGSPQYAPIIASITPGTALYESGVREGEVIKSINDKSVLSSKEAMKSIVSIVIQGEKLNIITNKGKYEINYKGEDFSKYGRSIDKGIGIYFVGPKAEYLIDKILPNSPAERAGIMLGDIILEVDGKKILSSSWAINKILNNNDKETELKISRNNKIFTVSLMADKKIVNGVEAKIIGIGFSMINVIEAAPSTESFLIAIPKSISNVQNDIYNTFFALGKLLSAELSPKSLSGPVAILDYSGKAAFNGLYSYINLIALISVGIGFFNLLPLPMLDGGQILVHSIEAIRRKDFTAKFQKNLQFSGIIMLLTFMVFVMVQDLRNLF